ncbi:aminopeptidase P family protein [Acinetobacter guillouiae]|uniref:aminopeptidase P family protein n=1 Tax=Acinetobacter TaxID=469 RepID=UPI00141BC9DA|nr:MULTISPECIES: aminopeptidase P family protein [Acinetobacter]MCS4297880.1 Xaa-Pro aminopeptidase [Acinetobacter guillouiae]MCU4492073.1 aminopeptidase P family protein [Acinetobacter guillouiae]MCW2251484.1 Xaa-Pro aminopeptidase [Acinetobacter sp. BIGb0204]NII36018.1 Xaa-Pro aminopeptidase [Acinetobacter sp. BIGb0196]
MNSLSPANKLENLRTIMKKYQQDAFIAMSADPHMSEYLPDYWKIRQWLTGFTGSVGTIVVTQNFAGLWVDGRYWVQAEQQLENTGYVLQKQTHDPASTHLAWLSQHLAKDAKISVNGNTISTQQYSALSALAIEHNFVIQTDLDLIDEIWTERPALPLQPIWQMADDLNAQTRLEKITAIRHKLIQKKATGHFISALDDIAWILNCRGRDVEYNPVFLAHLYIDHSRTVLFIDDAKLSTEMQQRFALDNIEILAYNASIKFLLELKQQNILIDPAKVSISSAQAIEQQSHLVQDINPSSLFKSRKHPSEIAHVRSAMTKDGVALCHFFHWLDNALADKESINELTIDEKITAYRAQQDGFIGLSFSTIAGFNANGALPHYRATEESFSAISGDGLLLIDSGAQYDEGTTDITRVVPIGTASAEQKCDYTLVLKSHIALAQSVFPEGIASPLLDAITRQTLWKYGLDYRHGTGHGVGYALNVHEGPQVISYYAPVTPSTKMREGMITSNEPGLYHQGKYGIRIENLVVNKIKHFEDTTYGQFLEFETLTLCPINLTCIVLDLLSHDEKAWLNQYHQTVRERLAPHLEGDVLNWLNENTQAI